MRERRQTVIDAVKARGYAAPVALDEDDEAIETFQVSATPTVILLDGAGRAIGRAVGARPWTGPAGRRLLNELLNR